MCKHEYGVTRRHQSYYGRGSEYSRSLHHITCEQGLFQQLAKGINNKSGQENNKYNLQIGETGQTFHPIKIKYTPTPLEIKQLFVNQLSIKSLCRQQLKRLAGRRGARLLATMIAAEFGYASKREKNMFLRSGKQLVFFSTNVCVCVFDLWHEPWCL